MGGMVAAWLPIEFLMIFLNFCFRILDIHPKWRQQFRLWTINGKQGNPIADLGRSIPPKYAFVCYVDVVLDVFARPIPLFIIYTIDHTTNISVIVSQDCKDWSIFWLISHSADTDYYGVDLKLLAVLSSFFSLSPVRVTRECANWKDEEFELSYWDIELLFRPDRAGCDYIFVEDQWW